MLYKKVHRQYLREFKVGRELRFFGCKFVIKITKEPNIQGSYIWLNEWGLISLVTGIIIRDAEWLD